MCPVNEMGPPTIVEPSPGWSPLRLAESYNPSIGLACWSSQIAGCGQNIVVCQHFRHARMFAPRSNCNGKTACSRFHGCENAAVLRDGRLAGYDRASSFAVQLSIHSPPGGLVPLSYRLSGTQTAQSRWSSPNRRTSCHRAALTAKNHS